MGEIGKLFVVPTPIGNLSDITFRAVEVLAGVDLIAAEDTRQTKKLLARYKIETPMVSFHDHNEDEKIPELIRILKSKSLALVSDSGTPLVSDPGYKLVKACVNEGVSVLVLPGPTAFVPALVGSGLACNQFVFLGFLSKKGTARLGQLEDLRFETKTMIFYESAFRLASLLSDLKGVLGNRDVCIAREISKKHEEFLRGKLSEFGELAATENIVGEVVVVVGGAREKIWSKDDVVAALKIEVQEGVSLSEAAKKVAKNSGWKKRQVYSIGLGLKKN